MPGFLTKSFVVEKEDVGTVVVFVSRMSDKVKRITYLPNKNSENYYVYYEIPKEKALEFFGNTLTRVQAIAWCNANNIELQMSPG